MEMKNEERGPRMPVAGRFAGMRRFAFRFATVVGFVFFTKKILLLWCGPSVSVPARNPYPLVRADKLLLLTDTQTSIVTMNLLRMLNNLDLNHFFIYPAAKLSECDENYPRH